VLQDSRPLCLSGMEACATAPLGARTRRECQPSGRRIGRSRVDAAHPFGWINSKRLASVITELSRSIATAHVRLLIADAQDLNSFIQAIREAGATTILEARNPPAKPRGEDSFRSN